MAGPCESTFEPCPAASPSTEYDYHPDAGTYSSGRLFHQRRKYNGGASELVTTYEDYTAMGEPQKVTDENGIATLFGYRGHQVAWRKVDFAHDAGVKPQWTYTWDTGMLAAVQFPDGNFEVYCYRATTSPSCSGAWTNRLTSKTKAADAAAATWTERVEYTYWPDGALKSETKSVWNGTAAQVRQTRSFAVDPLSRPSLWTVGSGAGGFSGWTVHDGDDNVSAVAPPYNGAPAFCGSPGALSALCKQMTYDGAGHISGLAVSPNGQASTLQRTCINYDAAGTVRAVIDGCGAAESCATGPGSLTSCSGLERNDYFHDDFGNISQVSLVGTTVFGQGTKGTTLYDYDIAGNLVIEQSQRYVRHTYALARRTATYEGWGDFYGAHTDYVVAKYSYDGDVTTIPNKAGCPVPLRTMGRLRAVWEPLFTRWYQYDAEGRQTLEARAPAGQGCGGYSLSLGYTANGNLAFMKYGHGREVQYVYGAGAARDRVTSVKTNVYLADAGVSTQTLVDSVTFEPYGDMKSYRMSFPSDAGVLFATLDKEKGSAQTTPAANCPTVALAEANDLTGRLRSIRVWDGATNIYRKVYTWKADEIEKVSTCYKGGPEYLVESFSPDAGAGLGYDMAGQLKGGTTNFATAGGPYQVRKYAYDRKGSMLSAEVSSDAGYAFVLASSPTSIQPWLVTAQASAWNRIDYAHDEDGNVISATGPIDSSGAPSSILSLGYSVADAGVVAPGSTTVLRNSRRYNSTQAGGVYNYWYDAQNRRQAKVYPVNNKMDFFQYDNGHQLLEDVGLKDFVSTERPVDEYVWLGGVPIAALRSKLTAAGAHAADGVGNCSRLGDGANCGLYFLVTDSIGKPVLALNSNRQIVGVGEYEPFGGMNKVAWPIERGFPYSKAVIATDSTAPTMAQRELGMQVSMRSHFSMVDTEQNCSGAIREGPSLWNNALTTKFQQLGGYHRGEVWSQWYTPVSDGTGWRKMRLLWSATAGNCNPTNCTLACPQSSGAGWSYSGFVHREYEYRRFEGGTTPYFTPLRFPGQYADAETGMYENWNRYYDPSIGRYLQPEPMLQDPKVVAATARQGQSMPVYSYAYNNPLHFTDPTGLYSWQRECPNKGVFERGFAIETSPLGRLRSPRRLRPTPGSVAFHNFGEDACTDCREAKAISNNSFEFSFAADCWADLVKEICDACEQSKDKCKPEPRFPDPDHPLPGDPTDHRRGSLGG